MLASAYTQEVINRLRKYYGSNVLRIVRFDYDIELIQILVSIDVNIKAMRDQLLEVLDDLLVINIAEKKCIRIYFWYGYLPQKESIFINLDQMGLRWLQLRNLDPADYVTKQEYAHLQSGQTDISISK